MSRKLVLSAAMLASFVAMGQSELHLFVGTYTKACHSDGIYSYTFNQETGDAKPLGATAGHPVNPSFLSVQQDKVFAVNENGKQSTISTFLKKDGRLQFSNKVNAQGEDPCYIISDKHHVITANYSSGSISVFPIVDGKLEKAIQIISHDGKGPHERQEKSHVHMVQFSDDKRFVFAVDLGTDAVYTYKYDSKSDKPLTFENKFSVKSASGPRHLTFSADNRFAYLIQELDGTLTVLAYDNGNFTKLQETSVVESGFTGQTSAADVHLSPDGKFLYATNRGDANTVAVFSVSKNGKLKMVETIASGGKGPRNFTISPNGKFLLVAHQYTNNITVFSRDAKTGKLTDSGKPIEVCSPVCLVFE